MFTNIAVVAQAGMELQHIRSKLRNPVKYTVREFLTLDDVNHGLKNFPFDILLLRIPMFDAPQVNIVLKSRLHFPSVGLITISPDIRPSARYQVREVAKHKLLLEPMEVEDLAQVVEKLARGEAAPTRMHPRVHRNGECELVDPDKGSRLKCKFVDFAQMGARLLLQPRVPLRKNARYQLHYRSSSEPNHVHRIETSIVWAEIQSGMVGTIMRGPQQMVGLRFLATL